MNDMNPMEALRWDNERSVSTPEEHKPLVYHSLKSILEEESEPEVMVVDQLLAESSFSILSGKPKAGKTTFTKELAKSLGVTDRVHSPTFILKREYGMPHHKIKRIIHIDAYRFTHPKEAKVLQLEKDLKDENAVIIVEWPDKMNYLKSDLKINFKVIDDETREVTIEYEE